MQSRSPTIYQQKITRKNNTYVKENEVHNCIIDTKLNSASSFVSEIFQQFSLNLEQQLRNSNLSHPISNGWTLRFLELLCFLKKRRKLNFHIFSCMYNSSQNIREKKIFSKIQMHIMICDNKDHQKPKKESKVWTQSCKCRPINFCHQDNQFPITILLVAKST